MRAKGCNVVLVVDSVDNERRQILSSYKADRDHHGFSAKQVLLDVLQMATAIAGVSYVKVDGLEADDIISSYIKYSASEYAVMPIVFANDNDIMQTDADYYIFHQFKKGAFGDPDIVDRRAYISNKYGYELNYLPVWEKVLRGDNSDGIPNICPRAVKDVKAAVIDNKDHQDLEVFIEYIRKSPLYKKFGGEDLIDKVTINYRVVVPKYRPLSEFVPAVAECDKERMDQLRLKYGIAYI
jgi:hypothetical protein